MRLFQNLMLENIMDYFKHDINASEDDKICDLLAKAGYEMLGYYWRFIEYLYSRGGKILKSKICSVAWSLHMDIDKLNALISDFDLFVDDGEYIFSRRVVAEIEEFEAKGKRKSEAGRKGGQASAKARYEAKNEADVNGCLTVAEADVDDCSTKEKKEKKENKIKRKENILKEKKNPYGFFSNVFLTDTEFERLTQTLPDYNEYIDRLSYYLESKGDHYKSHYATILTWYRKDVAEEKQKQIAAEPPKPKKKSF